MTVSIGFVCLAEATTPSVIIGRADQALYSAKQNGKNQVCLYEELAGTGKLPKMHYSEDVELF